MKQIGVAILFVGLIALIISLIFYCVDWSHGRHAKLLWGLAESDARPDTVYIAKHDTTIVIKHDTVTVYKPVSATHVSGNQGNTQKNKNGDNKLYQNNGTNNGHIGDNSFNGRADSGSQVHVGDNIYFFHKMLSERGKAFVLEQLKKAEKENNLTNKMVSVSIPTDAGELKILPQLTALLSSNGYNVCSSGTYSSNEYTDSITFKKLHALKIDGDFDYIEVKVGVF